MNIYDFDKTIYDGDSTADFIKYCAKRFPKAYITILPTVWAFLLYIIGIYTKTQFKERMYRFLKYIPDIDTVLEDYWDKHEHNIFDYYKKQHDETDIVISASPEFLLEPICKRLNIKRLIASRVDKHTGKYDGENCWGAEKVSRLKDKYGIEHCDKFYSDSYSDTPLALIADEAFIFCKNELTPWNEPKKENKLRKMFLSAEFILFLVVGVINTLSNIIFSGIYSMFIPNTTAAFLPGYITSNITAYFLNSMITFKERLSFVRYIKFFISYIPNFAIQTLTVYLFDEFTDYPSIIAYAAAAVIGIPVTFILMKVFAFKKAK